ncbi:hypothetical protein [Spirillospora albida]|uniref:hypothetical protein n=1 Tax=Spirillospora albida TaxID=58123 RepID=UPI0004C21499|nr:hypothetical protein [Spirillospora albida]
MADTTYRRLNELGIATEDADGADVLGFLDACGLVVWAPAGEVADLEAAYREFLEDAAACGGAPVADVELVVDEDGDESLHFLRGGEPVWWAVEHPEPGRLDLQTIMECVDDLEPAGDPRMFYALPGEDPDEDDAYVLATPEQARVLRDEYGLDLEGLDRVKAPPAEPPTADPGTLDWYMQADRARMTPPARAFLDRWTDGMADALGEWRVACLPAGFPFDFSAASLAALERLVLDRYPDRAAVIAAGGDPFIEGAVRYLGECLLRDVPCRWGYQDLGLSDAYDRIPMVRSNTPPGFLQTVIPLHRLAALAAERRPGLLAGSSAFLRAAVDAHRKAVAARRP